MALAKLQKYCAYQERCHYDVRNKLLQLKVYGDDLEEVITELIKDNYLNEERYAQSYIRGKYRMKKWGRRKILQELNRKKISVYCIKKGLKEIDEEEYMDNLRSIINVRLRKYTTPLDYMSRQKIKAFCYNKGYEPSEIQTVLEEER
jgi:regulatory protein